jgi:Ribbon-helix-helix protein, copG family
MNFNIYLDDETGQQLTIAAKDSGENRNALIRQAVAEWLARHGKPQWPEAVLSFQGITDMPAFESSRDQLRAPSSAPPPA